MTLEDYKKLSPQQQEDFTNEGGEIVDLKQHLENCVPSVDATADGQVRQGLQECLPNSAQGAVFSQLPPQTNQFDGFMILNPAELLFLVDDEISSGRTILHDWQLQFMIDFANEKHDDKFPFQAVVRAANGSGKDKYIIAACVVWLCLRYQKAIGVVTSASGTQLDIQTCRHIKNLCEAFNVKFQFTIWDCKYRQYQCNFGNGVTSNIYCYATDEAGKAEGYHPNEQGAKMGLFVSEDKSVTDDINNALNKCTGYSHRVHVSTPGLPMGHFYNYCMSSFKRVDITDVKSVATIDWIEYHITAHQCSHLSKDYFKQMERDLPGGKNGAAYKSQVEAEFGTTDEMVVIPYTYIWQAVRNKIDWVQEPFNTAGLDLSDGGAETVLTTRNGNKLLKLIPFKFDDTEDTVAFLDEKFRENGLNNSQSIINADCIGIGKPILDRLRRMGWKNIRYVDSRAKAQYPRTYLNRGTEVFFNMSKLLARKEIILLEDTLLMNQLGGRYYKITTNGVHQLLSKIEQRSRGYPSPDRADSCNLCFWNYKSTFVEVLPEAKDLPLGEPEEEKPLVGAFDLRIDAKNGSKKWIANGGQKDFSYLQSEIEDYNMRKQQLTTN